MLTHSDAITSSMVPLPVSTGTVKGGVNGPVKLLVSIWPFQALVDVPFRAARVLVLAHLIPLKDQVVAVSIGVDRVVGKQNVLRRRGRRSVYEHVRPATREGREIGRRNAQHANLSCGRG